MERLILTVDVLNRELLIYNVYSDHYIKNWRRIETMVMKRKVLAGLLCTVLTMSMLSGCTVNINLNNTPKTEEEEAVEETGDAEDVEQAEETEETEEIEKAEEAEEEEAATGPELESVDFNISVNDAQNDHMVFECYGNSFMCSEGSAVSFPKLNEALKAIDEDEKTAYKSTMDEFMEDAVEFAAGQKTEGADYTYYLYSETALQSADDKAVSLLRTEYGYLGGAHPDYYYVGVNLDSQTGQEIRLSDIIADKDGLKAILIDKLNEKYPDGNFFGLEESLDDFALDEDSDEGKALYTFTLSPTGISLYFGPYDLNSYADGSQQIDLTYDEISDILKDDYLYKE